MEILSIRHKPLRRFAETGSPRGLPGNLVERLRGMLAFVAAAESVDELLVPPNYGAHRLTGDRSGCWSLAVSRNWRLTFYVNATGGVEDMDLEDYH